MLPAQAYGAAGLPVFPVYWTRGDGQCVCGQCQPDSTSRGKHPMTPRGSTDASTSAEQIAAWWSIAPEANIGLAIPDGLIVLDVDPRNGGTETYQGLLTSQGLPATRAAYTGGGGLHLWYRVPAGLAFPGKLGKGIDVKQLGGYVIAPPSTHYSGRRYEWATAPDAPIADAPPWVVALGYPRGERKAATAVDATEVTAEIEALDRIVTLIEPHYVQGHKHALAKNLGGWMKQRGFSAGDVAYVVSQLPSNDPDARVRGALAAFGIDKPFGWHELRAIVSPAAAAELERAVPNPRWQAELANRAAAATLMPSFQQPAPTSSSSSPPGVPAWFQPRDLKVELPPTRHIVSELELGPGRVNMVAGYSNAGKSIVTLALVFAIAMGRPAWERFPVQRTRVLYLDRENPDVSQANLYRLANAYGVSRAELEQWFTFIGGGPYLDAGTTEAELLSVIQGGGYGLVVHDTLRASLGGTDENKPEVATPLYMLGRVSHATGATIVLLHHERKPEGERRTQPEHMISGHNAIHGALGVGISLVSDKASAVRVQASKRIRRGFDPFRLQILDVDAPPSGDLGEQIASARLPGQPSHGVRVVYAPEQGPTPKAEADGIAVAAQKLLAFLATRDRPVRQDALFTELGVRKSYAIAAIERLHYAGQITIGGPPKVVSLRIDRPTFDPSVLFKPPELSARESHDALVQALQGAPQQ